jgi:dTDP-4-amino-4,6-dideoxygalactose transaminase
MSSSAASLSVPANDFRALWQEIQSDATAALQRVGQSGWYILGKEVLAFEAALARTWGLEHAVGCGNGMDAIEIALRAGGLKPGDKVITTPLSAFATTLAILRAGGVPVFVDVDAHGLLDLDLVGALLSEASHIKWMVPVHLFGQCMDLTKLAALQDRYGLNIVEDCAQSIGATWSGLPCGSVGFAATTSFYPTKNLGAMGDGGALLTNDAALAASARQWRDYGQSEKYVHALPGLNSRLDELQAAILLDALLPRLAKFTATRREIAARYRAELKQDYLHLLPEVPASDSVHHLFPVLVPGDRSGFMSHLKAQGVMAGIHYPKLISDQPGLEQAEILTWGKLPMAEKFAAQEVSLPIHPHLSQVQVDLVIAACNAWPG